MSRPTRLRRDSRHSRLALEPLEDRRLLDASVSIADVVPSLRNESPEEIVFQFSEPVTGFDVDDVRLIHDGGSVDLSNLVLVSTDGGQTYTLGDISTLPTGGGAYWLGLDVANAGIVDLANGEPLSIDGIGLGPELIVNGSFDVAGGGSDDLSGWSIPRGGVIWQEEASGDGVARVTSNHAGTLIDPNMPDGATAAKIRQGITTTPLTNYRLEFDLVTRQVVTEISSTDIRLQVFKGDPRTSLLFQETYDKSHNGHQVLEFATEPDDLGITLRFLASRSNRDFTVDNVSVREVIVGPSVQWTVDTTMPTVSILPVSPSPRNSRVEDLTIAFNEPIVGFDLSDLILTRDSGDGPQTVSMAQIAQLSTSDNTTFLLGNLSSLTGADGTYQLSLDPVDSLIQDLATNELGGGDQQTWVMDRVAPMVSVNLQLDEDDRTPALRGTVDDPNATIAVTIAGSTYAAVNRGDGTWILPDDTIDPLLIDGTYDVLATATDAAGNVATDDTTDELVIDGPPIVFQVTASFQDGVFPTPDYAGTRDAPIFASDADVNFGDAVTLRADAEQSSTGQPAWALFKWDLSSIPVGATVDEVSLTVNVTNITVAPGFHLFEVKTPWLESEVTWNGPDAEGTWEDPGLIDPIDAGEAILGTLPGTALGPLTISLTAEGLDLVQRWISDPSTNRGFLLSNPDNTNSVRFDSREGTTPEDRPKLSVDFDFIDTDPPTATLTFPADNGPADQDDDLGEVRVGLRNRIEIQLSDFALNDATVTAETVTLTKDGQPVSDVAFAFDTEMALITLTPAIAPFPAGDYRVTLNDSDSKIADTAGNQLPRTVFTIQFDDTLPTNPIARDDSYETDEDTPLVVSAEDGVLANDDDGSNPQLTAVVVTPPEHGTIDLSEDGSFTYTPEARFVGQDLFTYFIDVSLLDSSEAIVRVTVISGTPQATNDAYETDEDTPLLIDAATGVLANDADPQNDSLIAVLVDGPNSGELTLNGDGSFQYAPDPDFFGVDSFTYEVSDGEFMSPPAMVSITVTGVNDAPVASDESYFVGLGDTLVVNSTSGVLSNDADADGDVLNASIVSVPLHGEVELRPDGSFVYTPNPGFDGSDQFTYRASDGLSDSATATVMLFVGTFPPTEILGTVFDDTNGDGVRGPDEGGVRGAVAELFSAGEDAARGGGDDISLGILTTGEDGAYRFSDLADGTYYLHFRPPFGLFFGPQDQGSDDEVDSDASSLGFTDVITLAVGQIDDARDASMVGVPPTFGFAFAISRIANGSKSSIAVDGDGALYVGGELRGVVDVDHGPSTHILESTAILHTDVYLVKYTAEGALVWARLAPGTQAPDARRGFADSETLAITLDDDNNVYATGALRSDATFGGDVETTLEANGASNIFITKHDSNGRFLWGHSLGGPSTVSTSTRTTDIGRDIKVDGDGNVWVIGGYLGNVDFDPGPSESILLGGGGSESTFALKLNGDGEFLWAGTVAGQASAIEIAPNGNIVIGGRFGNGVDFDPGPAVVTPDGSGLSGYILTLTPSGDFVWVAGFGGDAQVFASDIGIDRDGNIYATGTFLPIADFDPGPGVVEVHGGGAFVTKFDSEGQFRWVERLGSAHGANGRSITVDDSGTVYVLGDFEGILDFDPGPNERILSFRDGKVFLLAIGANGDFEYALTVGSEVATDISVDSAGNIFGAGMILFSSDFDPGIGSLILGGGGHESTFVTKILSPSGIHGSAWVDIDQNGVKDDGEPPLMGAAVTLFHTVDDIAGNANDVQIGQTQYTESDGTYSFLGLQQGVYYLRFEAPVGFGFTAPDQGADESSDSDADLLTGLTGLIALEVGQIDGTQDVGLLDLTGDNRPPQVTEDAYVIDEDTILTVDVSGVLLNDTDPNLDPLTVTLASQPKYGELSLNSDGSLTYIPDADFYGIETVSYSASDGQVDSLLTEISITILSVNDRPIAGDDTYLTPRDVPLVVDVASGLLANDGDRDGDHLSVRIVDSPKNGTISVAWDGSFAYTPNVGYVGNESFSYQADDRKELSELASVTIVVGN
ncbi:MAG: tandem-95 repeat protein, partial [Planctomycetes bacterium]|nr:tandem-95 repeat protein [Planctomycetota bacterium]